MEPTDPPVTLPPEWERAYQEALVTGTGVVLPNGNSASLREIQVSQLILEFPLDADLVTLSEGGDLRVELGNGVALKTFVPTWVRWINTAKLTLTMEVEGSPTNVSTGPAPIG